MHGVLTQKVTMRHVNYNLLVDLWCSLYIRLSVFLEDICTVFGTLCTAATVAICCRCNISCCYVYSESDAHRDVTCVVVSSAFLDWWHL